ncbi:hypothetical protein ABZO31_08950 [Streptomyces sp. HUAS MG47]|uniref:hypothetical protein n=1 Tax=Streptomyces solicamelliae TaxID=3231716 RepID=UPI003877B310
MTADPRVKESTFEIHNSQAAADEWRRIAGYESVLDEMIGALPTRLRLAKGTPLNEGETVGFTSVTTLDGPLPTPAGVTTRDQVEKLNNGFFARTFTGEHGEQMAACATVIEVPGTGFKKVDAFVLEARDGDLLNAKELGVTPANVLEERDGWWDALTGCLGRDCGGVCLSAALSCPKVNWAAFLICLAGRCGVCVVKCAACATCDCTWWCKWAAGCCDN